MRIAASDYHEIVKVADPNLSPDGDTVAFVRLEPDGDDAYDATVYTVPADGSGEPEPFTMGEGGASQPRWSPSGDRLAFVSARGGDRPQLWVAPTGGGEAQRVTNVPGGVGSIAWSPDGSEIAFLQETTPEERESGDDCGMAGDYERVDHDPRVVDRMKYRLETGGRPSRGWEVYFDGTRTHVYVADVEEGSVERVTDGDRDQFAPAWGSASDLYFLGKYRGEDDDTVYDVVAHDRDSGSTETVTTTNVEANTVPALAATTDGRLAYPWDDPEVDLMAQTELRVYDRETGDSWLPTEPLDRKPSHSHGVSWGPDEEFVYFTTDDAGRMTIRRAPGDASEPPEQVVQGTAVNGASVGERRVVITHSEWDHPGDVFVAPLETGELERLTTVNADYLAEREVQEPEEFWYENGEGDEVQGWYLTPPDFDPSEEYPMVVQVHGGPSPVMWTTSGTMWHEFQTMAHEGYVVFWSNPRGSTGYGHDFMRAVARDWGGPFYRDVMAGTDAMVEREFVDEDNTFTTGGSYGGYMVGWTVGQTDRFAAGVAQRGVYDLKTMYGTTTFPELLEWYYDTLPWEEPELLWEHSPAAYADEVETPTLVIQSENDYNTPAADSETFYRYLKKAGAPVRYVLYPREGHELSRAGEPAHVVDRMERILRWFAGYSDHHDAAPALERDPGDGLSTDPVATTRD